MKQAPKAPVILDMSPVDWVAQCIVKISTEQVREIVTIVKII